MDGGMQVQRADCLKECFGLHWSVGIQSVSLWKWAVIDAGRQ